jgi:hypothetical protein
LHGIAHELRIRRRFCDADETPPPGIFVQDKNAWRPEYARRKRGLTVYKRSSLWLDLKRYLAEVRFHSCAHSPHHHSPAVFLYAAHGCRFAGSIGVTLKASASFPALRTGVFDLLSRNTSWKRVRESTLGLHQWTSSSKDGLKRTLSCKASRRLGLVRRQLEDCAMDEMTGLGTACTHGLSWTLRLNLVPRGIIDEVVGSAC